MARARKSLRESTQSRLRDLRAQQKADRIADDRMLAVVKPMSERMIESLGTAVYPPSAASACRWCGLWVGPDGEFSEVAGWRVCPACTIELSTPVTLASLWSHLLGEEVTSEEAVEITGQLGSPAYFRHTEPGLPPLRHPADKGLEHRWAFLDPQYADVAGSLLRRIRKRGTPGPNPSHTGCLWCGVNASPRWLATGGSWPKTPDGNRAREYVCSGCRPYWERTRQGRPDDVASWLVACACATGRHAQLSWASFDLTPYRRSEPVVPTGTDEPWAYLPDGSRGELRLRVLAGSPRLLATATERERRIVGLRRRQHEESTRGPDEDTPLVRL